MFLLLMLNLRTNLRFNFTQLHWLQLISCAWTVLFVVVKSPSFTSAAWIGVVVKFQQGVPPQAPSISCFCLGWCSSHCHTFSYSDHLLFDPWLFVVRSLYQLHHPKPAPALFSHRLQQNMTKFLINGFLLLFIWYDLFVLR